jgi:hypothetical protein
MKAETRRGCGDEIKHSPWAEDPPGLPMLGLFDGFLPSKFLAAFLTRKRRGHKILGG